MSSLIHTGFNGVRFHIRSNQRRMPDWEQGEIEQAFHVPGSNTTIVQYMGAEPALLTLRLYLPTWDDYLALRAALRTTGELTLFANTTSAAGTRVHLDGRDYDIFPNVQLAAITNAERELYAFVECDATFRATMDPVTRVIA